MKILIIDNAAVIKRGDTYCTNSLNGLFLTDLISCGNEIAYFQFASENENSISAFDLENNRVKYHPLKLYKNKILMYLFAHLAVIPLILKNDFIYFYYPSSFKYATYLCRLFGKRYGLYIRGEQGIKNNTSRKIYKRARVIFTVSDYFTNYVNELTGKKLAHTIRPMIPFTEKDIVTDRGYRVIEKYDILFLGRVAKDKGIEELLNAVKILKEKGYNFHLNIVGSGEFLPEAQSLLEKLDISDVACFKGAVQEAEKIKEYYVNADIYILPTYHEGFPRTLYEAMIFGAPIITTFVGGIPGLMKDGYNCREIEPKSVESIVDGLEFAFSNYDKIIEFAENGRVTVAEIVDSKRLTHAQHLNKLLKQ